MNFWWVNHKKTFRQEFDGKYIWSPKRKRNGHVNPFYETMREVQVGDIIFSFAGAAIRGFGIARTHCYPSPRPNEFGHIGESWNEIGWRVDVDFHKFTEPVRPILHMGALRSVLPQKYSPIKDQGYGNQNAYLAQIPRPMALVIAQLASPELLAIIQGIQAAETAETPLPELRGIDEWEERESAKISENRQIPETEKQALIKARRGQGKFKQNVLRIEHFCRVTRVDRPEHLIASHIKPWRESGHPWRWALFLTFRNLHSDWEKGALAQLFENLQNNIAAFPAVREAFFERHRENSVNNLQQRNIESCISQAVVKWLVDRAHSFNIQLESYHCYQYQRYPVPHPKYTICKLVLVFSDGPVSIIQIPTKNTPRQIWMERNLVTCIQQHKPLDVEEKLLDISLNNPQIFDQLKEDVTRLCAIM